MKKYKNFLILIILTMGMQALIYFLIKNFINDYHIINSIINVPLIKFFIYFYNSWYPFIIISAFIVYKNDSKNFYYLISTMLLVAFISQLTFIIYPSMIIRPTIEVKNITDWLLNFTYVNDTPAVNCLPSMHCIYCFITSYFIVKTKEINIKTKIFMLTYSFIIVLSTLFTKQHIVEDIMLSVVYSFITILIVSKNKERIINFTKKIGFE